MGSFKLFLFTIFGGLIIAIVLSGFNHANSPSQPFALKAGLLNEYNKVAAGKDIIAMVKIFNRAAEGRTDVVLYYTIKDAGGKVIISESETAAVETQMSVIRRFTMPETAAKGEYSFNVELSSLDKKNNAEASVGFNVIQITKKTRDFFLYAIGAITCINSIVILFKAKKATKEPKISEKELMKMGLIKTVEFKIPKSKGGAV